MIWNLMNLIFYKQHNESCILFSEHTLYSLKPTKTLRRKDFKISYFFMDPLRAFVPSWLNKH